MVGAGRKVQLRCNLLAGIAGIRPVRETDHQDWRRGAVVDLPRPSLRKLHSSAGLRRVPSACTVIPSGAKRNAATHRKAPVLCDGFRLCTPSALVRNADRLGTKSALAEMERERHSLPQDRPLSAGIWPALAPAPECRVPPGPFRKAERRTASSYRGQGVGRVTSGLSWRYLGGGERESARMLQRMAKRAEVPRSRGTVLRPGRDEIRLRSAPA
jgi:hypothetical protein